MLYKTRKLITVVGKNQPYCVTAFFIDSILINEPTISNRG